MSTSDPTCTVMVLSWNSEQWLQRALPSVTLAAAAVGADVWIVENGDASTTSELLAVWPSVHLLAARTNKGLASYNDAAVECGSDVVVTLNDDVIVESDFLVPLLRQFVDAEDVFAVAPDIRCFPPGSQESQGEATGASWRLGALRPGVERSRAGVSHILYGCGGATAWHREKFVALGGFDVLFFPGYWEDLDLSWRGWKRGWRCIYEPSSVVYHAGGGTFTHAGPEVRALQVRNEFLFHWKNLDARLLAVHTGLLPIRLANAVRRRDRARLTGFAEALPLFISAYRRRAAVRATFRRSDREVLRTIG
jgi:N-acetylglucosaminyl-diphospho-decaprenol L-rhamnosyltransferase